MDKIIVCVGLSWTENANEEIYYYKVPEEWHEKIDKGRFLYLINRKTDTFEVCILQILKLCDSITIQDNINIKPLSESEDLHLISEEYLFEIKKNIVKNHNNYSIKNLSKAINYKLKELDSQIFWVRMNPLNRKRKEYLKKIFYKDEIKEFIQKTKRTRNRWFCEFNNFEIDLIHVVNLFILKENICKVIDTNRSMQKNEKQIQKNKFMNELKLRASSIYLKGINRFKSNEPIGIDISRDGKNIILGRLTKFELYLNFFSFWNTINGLLTVSFIPIILLLLDSEKKVHLYFFLGIVYFITLILSDEIQVDNLVSFMNQLNCNEDKKVNYYKLFYFGVISVLIFIIFSIQVVYIPDIVDSISKFLIYFIGDILMSYTFLFITLTVIEVLIYLISCITATIFYIKRGKKFKTI